MPRIHLTLYAPASTMKPICRLTVPSPDDHFQLSSMLFHSLDRKIDGRISRPHSYTLSVNQISGGKRWTTGDSALTAHTDRSDTHLIGAVAAGVAVLRYLVVGRREPLQHLHVALMLSSAETQTRVGNYAHFSGVLQRSAVIRC